MQALNFPAFPFRFKNSENKTYIFDVIRKKFVQLQAEEWVRQHLIWYLIHHKNYPLSLMNVEKKLQVNGLLKRYDLVVFKKTGDIHILAECKAPTVKITQDSFDQTARYNKVLNSNFLIVTNGLDHYYCQQLLQEEKYRFLKSIPEYIP